MATTKSNTENTVDLTSIIPTLDNPVTLAPAVMEQVSKAMTELNLRALEYSQKYGYPF